ncbi:heat shock 70 kDa protein C precursor, partial [Reticulomyxa filosa]
LGVSLAHIEEKKIKMEAVTESVKFGGEDITNRLVAYMAGQFTNNNKDHYDELTRDVKVVEILRSHCVEAQAKLSTQKTYKKVIRDFHQGKNFQFNLSRTKFEELCKDHFLKCLQSVDEVLEKGGTFKTDIDAVYLVGGCTKIPKLRELIEKHVGISDVCVDKHCNSAVMQGTVIHAMILGSKMQADQSMTHLDVIWDDEKEAEKKEEEKKRRKKSRRTKMKRKKWKQK